MHNMIELTLRVATPDEGVAAELAEKLARIVVGLSGEPGVHTAGVDVERWQAHHHDHAHEPEAGEVGP